MRAVHRSVLGLCLFIVVLGCSDQEGTVSSPSIQEQSEFAAGSELSLYGVGQLARVVPNPCRDAEYRQFDFWIGRWNIFNPADQKIATSIITSELDGCVVMEDYIQNDGLQGRSLSTFDRQTGRWYQTFVNNVIAASSRLSGGLQGEQMVMTSSQPIFHFPTGTVRHRDVTVTWIPLAEGRVRQLFVRSLDGGPRETTFDGLYVPEPNLTRAPTRGFGLCKGPIPQFLQADFWVGSWQVSADPGPALGTSVVRKDLEDCLIEENFEARNGFKSRSFLYFDFVVEKWFRTYADNGGEHVELSGELVGDALVLTGTEEGPDGKKLDVRVTLESEREGEVRQVFEVSRDGGANWKGDLELRYTR